MSIIRFRLQGLYNQEWATYENFLIKAIKQTGADKLHLAIFLAMLESNAKDAAEALELIAKSEFTQLCNELDAKRDRLIGSANNFVRSFLHDDDAEVKEAAHSLMVVIDHYSGMAAEANDQESNRIISFVAELKNNHAAQITKLEGLARRLDQLSAANADYIKLQDDRTFSTAEQTAVRMVNVRKAGDTAIRAIWDTMDLALLVPETTTPDIERFVAQLNAENQNERTKLAARKGRAEGDKKL